MAEGDQGTRRYKWFRPREAVRGFGNQSSNTNNANVSLYNNSTGAQLLVVRGYRVSASAALSVDSAMVQGNPGGTLGNRQELMPNQATNPGVILINDFSAALTGTWRVIVPSGDDTYWPHNFPFALIPPGWALQFQGIGTGTSMRVDFLWEAITIDQLDYFWEWIG